jgi:FkbM family methyltransferase
MKMSLLDRLRRYTWFYRQHSPFELAWSGISLSQFGEDKFLEAYFFNQQSGFYVDIGGFHPYMYSNTYLFYRKGWRGIVVEPNPDNIAAFQRARPRDIILQLAISKQEGTASFSKQGACSGIDDETHVYKDDARRESKIAVKTRPLAAVLEENLPKNTAIDFMSVDCEGHDRMVLESNDWSRFRPRVILCEEHQARPGSPLDEYMASQGYAYYCHLHLTKVYLEKMEWSAHLPVVAQTRQR